MRRKRLSGQQAQGVGIAQAEGGSQATVNIDHAYHGPVSQFLPPSRSKARNRQQMLARVRSDWITGLLERSLHGAALIDLGLQEEPDAIANPWRFVVQESNRSARTLPQGTPIAEVYDEAGKEVLILGEPGSGKTTLLLQLARDLLDRAERDESHPIPVIFNLSRWAVKRRPFAEWLVDELHARDGYGVPRERAQEWMTEDEILPLLDGLDEVALKHRAACVEVINAYRKEHGLVPLVLCSRSKEYADISTCVNIRHAVTILPLTDKQVADYFQEMPSRLKTLKSAIMRDKELRALMRTPLMLTIFTLAYQSGNAPDMHVSLTAEAKLKTVFAAYVEQMFNRRGQLREGTPEQYCRWLSYLARQMRGHNLTVFSMEDLQPDWLPDIQSSEYNKITGILRKRLEGKEIEPAEVLSWAVNTEGKREAQRQKLADRSHLKPNEGTWLSLKNGLTGGTRFEKLMKLYSVAFFGGLGLAGAVAGAPFAGAALLGFLAFSLYAFSDDYGLDAFINHFTMRFLLSRTNSLPWNLIVFLDEAADRRLLLKIGGSYIFVHPLLLDYFAD